MSSARPRLSAASITMGCDEHTDVMPRGTEIRDWPIVEQEPERLLAILFDGGGHVSVTILVR